MFDLEISQGCPLGKNLAEELPQLRDLPLPAAEIVKKRAEGFPFGNPKYVRERFVRRLYAHSALLDPQRGVGRDDRDPVRIDLHIVRGLLDGHLGAPRQQLRQGGRMIGSQVLDDNKGDAGIGRHVVEECFERLQSARGRAQRGDQELVRVALAHRSFL